MAGLEASRVLSEAGVALELFEKARGPGGRLSTRRMTNPEGEEGRLDFGAQFFSVFTDTFRNLISPLKGAGDIVEWFQKNGAPRHAIPAGMNALAKTWARGRKIHLQARVDSLLRTVGGIELQIEHASDRQLRTHGPFQAVILTAPVPQALELLERSAGGLLDDGEEKPWSGLSAVHYHPCIAAMLLLPESELGDFGRRIHERGFEDFEGTDEPWSWIASNSKKGLPCPAGWSALTVHLGTGYSTTHLERTGDPAFQDELLALFKSRGLISTSASRVGLQIHRWRYSLPGTLHASAFFRTAIRLPEGSRRASLLLAGDGFQKARVEGAFLSGNAAARSLVDCLQPLLSARV